MNISFDRITAADDPATSQCSECGALVLDIKRHIHVAWHERLEQALRAGERA